MDSDDAVMPMGSVMIYCPIATQEKMALRSEEVSETQRKADTRSIWRHSRPVRKAIVGDGVPN